MRSLTVSSTSPWRIWSTENGWGRTVTALQRRTRPVVRRTQKLHPPKAMVVAIPTERIFFRVVVGLKKGAKVTKFVCYKFQKGQCDKGKKCQFKHVKDDKSRTQSPERNRTRSPSKGNKDDKGKKMSKDASISTMTKPQPPLRTPKGPIHQHRRRRERSPMPLRVWLILTPSLHALQGNRSSISMKRVRFQKIPQVIEVNAV